MAFDHFYSRFDIGLNADRDQTTLQTRCNYQCDFIPVKGQNLRAKFIRSREFIPRRRDEPQGIPNAQATTVGQSPEFMYHSSIVISARGRGTVSPFAPMMSLRFEKSSVRISGIFLFLEN